MAARSLLICLVLTLSAATAPAGDSTNGAAPTAAEGSPEWLKMKLDAGDSAAVASLGIKLLLGKEARPEPKRGVALLSRAAAAGNALAECYMGIAFADGTGVPKNGLKAMDWFRASARDGCAAAFDYLGHGYESGLDGPRDSARAFQYYQQAAALGHGAGLWDAGVACQEGRGTTKDPVEALKWLQLADEAGYRAAVPRRGELEASLDATRKEEARRRAREFQPAKTYSVPLFDSEPVSVPLGDFLDVPVKIFGENRRLIIDTGIAVTMLDDSFKRRLPSLSPTLTTPGGDFEPRDCPEILVGQRRFAPLLAVTSDLKHIEEATGEPLAGVLGMNCLRFETVRFDSDGGQVTIGGAVPAEVKKNAMTIPLWKANNTTFGISAYINGRGPIFLAMDSGYAGAVLLNESDLQTVLGRIPEDARRTPFATTNGRIYDQKSVRLRSLVIGTNQCTNLIADCTKDPLSYSRFGQHLIKRFLCVADFPAGRLYLVPGRNFRAPDEYDMSGLSLLDVGGKLTVYAVEADSPAAGAGLQAEDQVVAVNDLKGAFLRLKAVRDILKTKPGGEISMQVRRGGRVISTSFRLKRLI